MSETPRPPLKPSFEEEFPDDPSTNWSDRDKRRFETGQISGGHAQLDAEPSPGAPTGEINSTDKETVETKKPGRNKDGSIDRRTLGHAGQLAADVRPDRQPQLEDLTGIGTIGIEAVRERNAREEAHKKGGA